MSVLPRYAENIEITDLGRDDRPLDEITDLGILDFCLESTDLWTRSLTSDADETFNPGGFAYWPVWPMFPDMGPS